MDRAIGGCGCDRPPAQDDRDHEARDQQSQPGHGARAQSPGAARGAQEGLRAVASIEFEHFTKRYKDGFEAVRDMSLEVRDGEFMILVGPSGSGKSTALRMVAGLEDITDGELRIGGEVVNDRAPKDRSVAMVFQSYALYPHMTDADPTTPKEANMQHHFGTPPRHRDPADHGQGHAPSAQALTVRERTQAGPAPMIATLATTRDRSQGDGSSADPRPRAASRPQAGEPIGRAAPARGDGPRDRPQPECVPHG